MSKLEAVNTLLTAIGEAPVTSLLSPSADVAAAVTALDRRTKAILATGWSDNTDDDVTLPLDVNGNIVIPASVITADSVGTSANIDVLIRRDPTDNARKLWDRKNKTFVFTASPTLRVVSLLDFDALSLALATFIAADAAVEFQSNTVGSAAMDKRLQAERANAKAALDDAEAEQDDVNILTDSPHCAWITYRASQLWGR